LPLFGKACENDSPGFSTGDANDPSFATTWWLTVSAFFQVTLSPTLIVVELGVNPLFTIWTVFVSAPAAATTTSVASSASGSRSMRFMWRSPRFSARFMGGVFPL
jgi:hypothetical protein